MAFKNYTQLNTKNANATTTKNDEVNTVAVQEHEASKLDLSYSHKTTFDVGKLVPIFQMQVMPGDVVDLDARTLLKMSIPAGPTELSSSRAVERASRSMRWRASASS